MLKQKQKLKLISVLSGAITLGLTVFSANTAIAGYNPIPRNLCTLMVNSFNPSGELLLGEGNGGFINYLSEAVCKSHANFPSAYKPQPPALDNINVVKAGSENKNMPITRHDHSYFNDSVQDHYYYKSFIDKFEITLQPDAFDSIDFNGIFCDTPVPKEYAGTDADKLANCNGKADDLWGGTTVTKQINNAKKTIVVTWKFAVNGIHTGRPPVWGNNGANFIVTDLNNNPISLNLTNENNRKLPFHVQLTTKDNRAKNQIWSGTTTSRVLLADLGLKKTNYPAHMSDGCFNEDINNSNSGWCYLPPNAGYQTEVVNANSKNRTYYWFPIGTVTTIWRSEKEVAPNKCTSLDLTWVPNSNKLSPNTPVTFKVTPHFTNPTVQALHYKWTATAPVNKIDFPVVDVIGADLLFGGQIEKPDPASLFQPGQQAANKVNAPGANANGNNGAAGNGIGAGNGGLPGANGGAGAPGANGNPGIPNPGNEGPGDGAGAPPKDPNAGNNKFADSAIAIDFANPYTDDDRETYYTGGPGGTHITVQAVEFPGCIASVDIPLAPPKVPVCQSLTLEPNTITPGLVTTYTAKVKFDDGKSYNTKVSWSQTKGKFLAGIWQVNSFAETHTSANPFISQFQTNDPTASITATVTDVIGAQNSNACKATVTGVQPPPLVCKSLKIDDPNIKNGILEFTPGQPLAETFTLTVDKPENLALTYHWQDNPADGKFDGNPSIYNDVNTTTDYINNNPKDGTKITVQAFAVGGGPFPQAQCLQTITLKEAAPPQGPVCQSLTLDPKTVTPGLVTTYTATVKFSDGKSYNTEVTWDQTKGKFLTGAGEANNFAENHTSADQFISDFQTNDPTATVTATVTNVVGAQNSNACKATATGVPPIAPVCDDSKFTLQSSNGNILSANQGSTLLASGKNTDNSDINLLIWTTPAGTLTPSGNCTGQPAAQVQTLPASCPVIFSGAPAGTVVTVSAVPIESGNICKRSINVVEVKPPGPVCDDSKFTLQSSNGNILSANQGSTLLTSGKNTDNSDINLLIWTTPAGTLTPSGNCTGQPAAQSQTLPASCPVIFSGAPAGTVVTVSAVPIEPGNICKRNINVVGQPGICSNLQIISQGNGTDFCTQTITPEFSNQTVWTYTGGSSQNYNGNQCIHLNSTPPNATLSASIPGQPNCQQSITLPFVSPPPPSAPPTIIKDAKTQNSNSYSEVVNLSSNGDGTVQYRIRFTPNGITTTTLTDTISGGLIKGEYPQQFIPEVNTPLPGIISYMNDMNVSGIGPCNPEDANAQNCYKGDISTGLQLVKVSGPTITITYSGQVNNSSITMESCNKGYVCEEIYKNSVVTPYQVFNNQNQQTNFGQIKSNEVRIQIFCQYILTRAAGDIYLEQDLSSGVDIYKCSNYKSSTGVLVTPALETTQILNKTGSGETVTIGHEVCSKGQLGTLPEQLKELYAKENFKLSSQICAVKLRPGSSWNKTAITNAIKENKTRAARWEPNIETGTAENPTTIHSISQIADQSNNKVFHIKDGDLVIDANSGFFAQNGDGANTIFVENGDLIIKSNIKVSQICNKAVCSLQKDTPSLAFVVLDGNIYIDKNVTIMSGVYFVQKGREGTGKYISGDKNDLDRKSTNSLTVLGSMYGDVQPLFENRQPAAGDPEKNEGTLLIIFDENIMINTPPGLQDIIDVSQSEVAR